MHKFENVLVLGIEKMSDASTSNATKYIGAAGDRILDQAEGLIFPAKYALIAQQHMLKYGTTSNDLALVALKNHENANLNENAHFYGKKVNLEMIENSPMVCSPLRLYDCSPITDGAAALVISKERKGARDLEIIASAFTADTISLAQRNDATAFDAARRAAESAYKQAGIGAQDVDFAEVHDCFTIAEMVAMEDLGFCKKGESKELIRNGATKLNAELPINASGGLKASGHPIGATGVSQICEIAIQLRGEAQKRQIKGANNIGLAHNVGGIGGSCAVHILRGK
ncbi:MAG: thiolase domain-containing protein, partial [Candidatus Diapherotrites archaeon]|nr:thiolase domain-containing protein [Candidatus Diapherotrites archaeon]